MNSKMNLKPPLLLATASVGIAICLCGSAHAQDPGWETDAAAFQYSMTVTSAVFVDGERVDGPGYVLAAFVDGEVRGVAEPSEVGQKTVFFLTVFANENGEPITFGIYDAAADSIRLGEQLLRFRSNGILGIPSAPYRLDAGVDPIVNDPTSWTVDPASFGATMTATVRVGIDGEPLADSNAKLAAFVGSEVRGTAPATMITVPNDGTSALFFLTLFANVDGEVVTLRISSPATDTIYTFKDVFEFASGERLGGPDSPLVVGSPLTTSVDPASAVGPTAFSVFPNPAASVVHLAWHSDGGATVRVQTFDIRGRKVEDLGEIAGSSGHHELSIDLADNPASRYPPGVYFVRWTAGRDATTTRFVVAR